MGGSHTPAISPAQLETALGAWADQIPEELASQLPALAKGLADITANGDVEAQMQEVSQVGDISTGILQVIRKSETKDRAIDRMRLDQAVKNATEAFRAAGNQEIRLQGQADAALKAERTAIDRHRSADRALDKAVVADKAAAREHRSADLQAQRVAQRNAAAEVELARARSRRPCQAGPREGRRGSRRRPEGDRQSP